MKPNFIISLLGILGTALGLSSCTKCQNCTYTYNHGGKLNRTVCSDDYGSKAEYNAEVKALETFGYTCD